MKILLVILSNSIGGAEKQARVLAQKFIESNHDVEMLFLRKTDLRELNVQKNLKVPTNQFNFPRKKLSPKFLTQLIKLFFFFKRRKFDLIHSFLPEAVALISITQLFLGKKTIHIAGVRGEYFKKYDLRAKLYIKLIQQSHHVICNSDSLKEVCLTKYRIPSHNVSVIPNGVQLLPKLGNGLNHPPRAVVVANYHKYKGYDILFSSLMNVCLPMELHIIGRGEFEKIFQEEIRRLPKNIKLVIRGEIDAIAVYESFDFAIHPSTTEGMSNAIMEALSAGLPVVAFNVGGNTELIHDSFNGIIVSELDSLKLAEGINLLLRDSVLVKNLSQHAIDSMRKYNFEVMASQHIQLYQDILSSQ